MDKSLPLTEHLGELRNRLIKSAIVVIIVSCILYNFIDVILSFVAKPVGKLVFITPQEAFVTNIKIAFWGGLLLSSPYLLYHIWGFVSIALKPNEKKYALIFGILSLIFFIVGAIFGYFIIVPIGIKFLIGTASSLLTPMITVSNYISFVGGLTFVFGAVFELPLVLLFLTKIGLVTPQFLSKRRRHAIVLIFIVAGFLTPPDVISQCLMAGPLLVLYEIGIIFSRMGYKPRLKELQGGLTG